MSDCPDCSCKDFEKCVRILHLILDNEASTDQEYYFRAHIEKCIVCFNNYNVEKQIRELVKMKLTDKEVPATLVEEIKAKILEQKKSSNDYPK